MWDLSSQTRGQTHVHYTGGVSTSGPAGKLQIVHFKYVQPIIFQPHFNKVIYIFNVNNIKATFLLKILSVSVRVKVSVLTVANKLHMAWISITSAPRAHSTSATWASSLLLEHAKCTTASGLSQRRLPLPVSLMTYSLLFQVFAQVQSSELIFL